MIANGPMAGLFMATMIERPPPPEVLMAEGSDRRRWMMQGPKVIKPGLNRPLAIHLPITSSHGALEDSEIDSAPMARHVYGENDRRDLRRHRCRWQQRNKRRRPMQGQARTNKRMGVGDERMGGQTGG